MSQVCWEFFHSVDILSKYTEKKVAQCLVSWLEILEWKSNGPNAVVGVKFIGSDCLLDHFIRFLPDFLFWCYSRRHHVTLQRRNFLSCRKWFFLLSVDFPSNFIACNIHTIWRISYIFYIRLFPLSIYVLHFFLSFIMYASQYTEYITRIL